MTSLPLNNGLLVKLTGLKDASDDSYVNDSTSVNVTIEDAVTQKTVLSSTNLPFVTSSNGNYQAVISKSNLSSLKDGHRYIVRVTSSDGEWTQELVAKKRLKT